MSSIGQITLAHAARVVWTAAWKGVLWAVSVLLTCYTVGIELNWRVFVVATSACFFDSVIYRPSNAVGTPGVSP